MMPPFFVLFKVGVDAFGVDAFGVDAFGFDAFGLDAFGFDAFRDFPLLRKLKPSPPRCLFLVSILLTLCLDFRRVSHSLFCIFPEAF